jgi:hypothetical protein
MFVINCDSAKDISRHSFYRTVNDILIHPAQQFQVISSFSSENEMSIIHLKEVQQTFPLIDILPQTSSIISHKNSYKNNNFKISLTNVNIVVEAAINGKNCNELWLEKKRNHFSWCIDHG